MAPTAHEHVHGPAGLARLLGREAAAYRHGEDRPIGGFAALLGVYGGFVGTLVGIGRARGARLPERVAPGDLALVSVATHKLARIIAKDPVTSPLRMPVTSFAGQSGEAEVAEEVRGTGFRHAVGELLTCPFCLGQWVATGFLGGLVIAPKPTRQVAAVFVAVTVADYLQFAYDGTQQAVSG